MATEALERPEPTLSENGALVEAFWSAIDHTDLDVIPDLVRKVIETGAWKERAHRGRVFRHERFLDFIVTKPLAGCGWPLDKSRSFSKTTPKS